MFKIWNLGDNVLLNWTHAAGAILILSVRHYAIAESVHAAAAAGDSTGMADAPRFINEVLAGPKYLKPDEFERVRAFFGATPEKTARQPAHGDRKRRHRDQRHGPLLRRVAGAQPRGGAA